MEFAFDSKELRAICEHESVAEEKLGPEIAEILRHRLADLRAVTSLADLTAGNPHLATVGSMECLVLDLRHRAQIVLQANHPENPSTTGGQVDWSKVSRVQVMHIGGEHE